MNYFPISDALISEAESEARIKQMVSEWFAEAAHERSKAKPVASMRKNENTTRKNVKHLVFA
jgi:hypothetical protein